jgi:hypothetical protein
VLLGGDVVQLSGDDARGELPGSEVVMLPADMWRAVRGHGVKLRNLVQVPVKYEPTV